MSSGNGLLQKQKRAGSALGLAGGLLAVWAMPQLRLNETDSDLDFRAQALAEAKRHGMMVELYAPRPRKIQMQKGAAGAFPTQLVNAQGAGDSNELFFVANYNELWKTDGRSKSTVRVHAFAKDTLAPSQLTPIGGNLLLVADLKNREGREPLMFDAQAGESRHLADILPGKLGSQAGDFTKLEDASGKAWQFFTAKSQFGLELWKTDGTSHNTVLVRDILPGIGSSQPQDLVAHGEHLYFTANDGVHGRELWKTDGSIAGTRLVADIHKSGSSDPSGLVVWKDRLMFQATNPFGDAELWSLDLGEKNAKPALYRNLKIVSSSEPRDLTVAGDRLFLIANGKTERSALWVFDQEMGAQKLLDLGSKSGSIQSLHAVGDRVIFSANDRKYGWEPWVSAGTIETTRILADIHHGSQGSHPLEFSSNDMGQVFFSAISEEHGRELWMSNGREIEMVSDLAAGDTSSNPEWIRFTERGMFFVASSGSDFHRDLWFLPHSKNPKAIATRSAILADPLVSALAPGELEGVLGQ